MNSIVLGAGAWGTAISIQLIRSKCNVTLIPRSNEHAIDILKNKENKSYLPGFTLSDSLRVTSDLGHVTNEKNILYIACPTKGIRSLCEMITRNNVNSNEIDFIVILSKGIEAKTFMSPYDIVKEYFKDVPLGVLSGPSFSREVAKANPTALTLATKHDEFASMIQKKISDDVFRVYISNDIYGVTYGGILKNIYAIGAGLCDGLGLGDNAKAAYVTRALNEIISIGKIFGAEKDTFYGLSGFGDLIATCFSNLSRNRKFGELIAKGSIPNDILAKQNTVVEGFSSMASIYKIVKERKVESPILEELYCVLYNQKSPKIALKSLMQRDLKYEV